SGTASPAQGGRELLPIRKTRGIGRCHRVPSGIGHTLLLHELSDVSEKIRTVYVAFKIRGHAFRHARSARVWIGTRIRYEGCDGTVRGAADANAALRARVKGITGLRQRQLSGVGPAVPRFGIGDVDHVVPVDVHAAWPSKLEPLGDEI